MLTQAEIDALVTKAREVPVTKSVYRSDNVVSALLETVVDYQMHTTAVRRALEHFRRERSQEIRTMEDLEACLARHPNTKDGNVDLARYLWGYRLWTRAQQLRGLVAYFACLGVTTLDEMKEWARRSTFEDFKGQVKGLGFAIYNWLVMRLGVATVKGDVHILRFVADAVSRPVAEEEAVRGLEETARRLNVSANVLDWSIWEHQRT